MVKNYCDAMLTFQSVCCWRNIFNLRSLSVNFARERRVGQVKGDMFVIFLSVIMNVILRYVCLMVFLSCSISNVMARHHFIS